MNDLSRITERYNLDKLIHAGDAASVFRATDLRSGEPVALKLLRGSARFSEPQRRERFESAARALGECRHRCLPSLLDFGVTAGGSAFLVTEYLPGVTLDLLTGSPAERVLPLLIPVLGALEELDRHQLAHRGLRADNLLVVPRGEPGGDELPAEGANDANDADGEQVKVLGWGSATWGAGEEGRRADLGAFAELTCTVLGARVERTPAAVVTLPAAAGTRIADAAELAILLSLLLQPGGPLPASLYAELRRAFRQALHGGADPEATQPRLLADVVTAPSGAAASRRRPAGPRPATRQLADLDDLDDLEQETRALRGDITMAVPRERLPRAPQGRPPTAAPGAGAAQPSAAETSARGDAAQVRSPLTAAGIRMETMPSFLASDLGGSPTGFPPPTAGSAANANAAELDIEPAAGTGQDAAPGSTAPEWTATRLIAPPAAADRSAPARATSGAILPFPSVQAAAGPAPAAATGAAAAVPAAASLPGAAPAPTAPMMIPATPTPALPAATAATTAAVPRAPAPPPPTAAPGAGPALDRPDVPATADRPGGTGGAGALSAGRAFCSTGRRRRCSCWPRWPDRPWCATSWPVTQGLGEPLRPRSLPARRPAGRQEASRSHPRPSCRPPPRNRSTRASRRRRRFWREAIQAEPGGFWQRSRPARRPASRRRTAQISSASPLPSPPTGGRGGRKSRPTWPRASGAATSAGSARRCPAPGGNPTCRPPSARI